MRAHDLHGDRDHDDFGGLHRDLRATGAALDRRGLLSRITLASDNVFSDGASLELATMTGNVGSGYTSTLTVAI